MGCMLMMFRVFITVTQMELSLPFDKPGIEEAGRESDL